MALVMLIVCHTRCTTTPQPFTHEEHSAFLDAMERFGQESTGNEWEKIAQVMGWLLVVDFKKQISVFFFFCPFSRLHFVPVLSCRQRCGGHGTFRVIFTYSTFAHKLLSFSCKGRSFVLLAAGGETQRRDDCYSCAVFHERRGYRALELL